MKFYEWDGTQSADWATAKLDGHYTTIAKDTFGRVKITTRKPVDITEQLKYHSCYQHAVRYLPYDVTVIGELYVPGSPASVVKTALKNSAPELEFVAFHIPLYRLRGRFAMEREFALMYGYRFPTFCGAYDEKHVERLLAVDDHEGIVYRRDGRCSTGETYDEPTFYKYKPVQTADIRCVGTTDGKGKYLGLVGALILEDGTQVSSGMSDDERTDFSFKPDLVVGKIVEVKYQYVGSKGGLRHPVFVRIRDDKS